MCQARLTIHFVADVDGVVLPVGADAPGIEKPSPAGDAVLPWRLVEDEDALVDIEIDIRLLDPVEIDLVVPIEVGG